MAATALCEHLSIELQNLGDAAAHVSAHSLHPSVGATNFFTSRDESGEQVTSSRDVKKSRTMLTNLRKSDGALTPVTLVNGLMKGLDDGKFYITVDGANDVPTAQQIMARAEQQAQGLQPKQARPFGVFNEIAEAAAAAVEAEAPKL